MKKHELFNLPISEFSRLYRPRAVLGTNHIIVTHDRGINLYDRKNGQFITTLERQPHHVTSLAVSPEGNSFVCWNNTAGVIEEWDIQKQVHKKIISIRQFCYNNTDYGSSKIIAYVNNDVVLLKTDEKNADLIPSQSRLFWLNLREKKIIHELLFDERFYSVIYKNGLLFCNAWVEGEGVKLYDFFKNCLGVFAIEGIEFLDLTVKKDLSKLYCLAPSSIFIFDIKSKTCEKKIPLVTTNYDSNCFHLIDEQFLLVDDFTGLVHIFNLNDGSSEMISSSKDRHQIVIDENNGQLLYLEQKVLHAYTLPVLQKGYLMNKLSEKVFAFFHFADQNREEECKELSDSNEYS